MADVLPVFLLHSRYYHENDMENFVYIVFTHYAYSGFDTNVRDVSFGFALSTNCVNIVYTLLLHSLYTMLTPSSQWIIQ